MKHYVLVLRNLFCPSIIFHINDKQLLHKSSFNYAIYSVCMLDVFQLLMQTVDKHIHVCAHIFPTIIWYFWHFAIVGSKPSCSYLWKILKVAVIEKGGVTFLVLNRMKTFFLESVMLFIIVSMLVFDKVMKLLNVCVFWNNSETHW